jgi:hypothetical protein
VTAGGRWGAGIPVVLGVAALIAAELLPWTTLHTRSDDSARVGADVVGDQDDLTGLYHFGLDRLTSNETLAYHLGLTVLLALVGVGLLGRPAQRRAAAGAGLGVLAAQLVIVIGLVHSFDNFFLSASLSLRALPPGYSTSVDPGAYCAFVGLALLLAALLISLLPARVRSRLVTGAAEPVEAQFTDAPMDLTVSPAHPNPMAESNFGRPDRFSR